MKEESDDYVEAVFVASSQIAATAMHPAHFQAADRLALTMTFITFPSGCIMSQNLPSIKLPSDDQWFIS
jgi:hypothetical protein